MFPWQTSTQPRDDLHALQSEWDQFGTYRRLRVLAELHGHTEPPLAAMLAGLVVVIVALALLAAAVPHGWLAA